MIIPSISLGVNSINLFLFQSYRLVVDEIRIKTSRVTLIGIHSFSYPSLSLQVASTIFPLPPPCEPAPAPAPFGSVGETTTTAEATGIPATTTISSRHYRSASSTPLPAHMERDLGMFVMTRSEERGDDNAVAVQEAQRRARRRALSQRKRASAKEAKNSAKECEVGLLVGVWMSLKSLLNLFGREHCQTGAPPRHSLQ